jgi:hypothetical protein
MFQKFHCARDTKMICLKICNKDITYVKIFFGVRSKTLQLDLNLWLKDSRILFPDYKISEFIHNSRIHQNFICKHYSELKT